MTDAALAELTDSQADRLLEADRPVKRQRLESIPVIEHGEAGDSSLVIRHPLGVRPSGNALTSSVNLKAACGTLAALPDELLIQLLETFEAPDLLRLGGTCRALYAFTRSEELWRALFVESHPRDFTWQGTWRSTYLAQPKDKEPRVGCSNLFSDVLHRPFFCAHVSLLPFASNIPKHNEIARMSDLSPQEFQREWVNRPFILTEPVKQWPVFKTWSTEELLAKYADVAFRAESVDWPLKTYIEYMNNNTDESPLYLFDRSFAEKMDLKVSTQPEHDAGYWPPTCFGSDLFSVLGAQRPDHRWLIVGPERSGSTFHKDPNATSAWNAVLKGSKYWIMFPSSANLPPPPGVYVSDDQSEVTSPLSIAEWLLGFHAEARRTAGCIEGICGEGEVLYVPSGWYHLVLNLEPAIAITQNFIPRKRVGAVLHFLRDQKQSISGFSDEIQDPYTLFVERLRDYDEQLLEEGLQELEKLSKGARGKWEQLTKGSVEDDDAGEGGFSFGFGGDDDDAEVP
ncbi:putative F-box and JmjC domain protein [Hortaea werneckii]|nr:putative F-box and JmjC domain protein [Hortaea werneckii]KAI6880683.1 putative F-box and JmjC domain protein [Hortaea werneckii]KAI6990327.1 putative F-box and JmjC domain protein [Hortaea werneckii]KAI7084531.1 putative F-box and JmjC domain protein [Hortaea werneckii]KAI7143565.1 putative F-box and JmjC domain protein [Hortaea werneckii]